MAKVELSTSDCNDSYGHSYPSPFRFIRLNPRFDELETLALLKVGVTVIS
jgi:hypothetical protein